MNNILEKSSPNGSCDPKTTTANLTTGKPPVKDRLLNHGLFLMLTDSVV
ncbi:hypothetical protein BH18ACI4_BH18ACI4_12640 [soil metagenome]